MIGGPKDLGDGGFGRTRDVRIFAITSKTELTPSRVGVCVCSCHFDLDARRLCQTADTADGVGSCRRPASELRIIGYRQSRLQRRRAEA